MEMEFMLMGMALDFLAKGDKDAEEDFWRCMETKTNEHK